MSGTALDNYTKFLCGFTNLLWYTDPHYNKLKLWGSCTFSEVIVKRLINFNKPSEPGHKAKPIKSSDASVKVNNLIEYLDLSYFSKLQVNLYKLSYIHGMEIRFWKKKYLKYLDKQVTRVTEAQNMAKK